MESPSWTGLAVLPISLLVVACTPLDPDNTLPASGAAGSDASVAAPVSAEQQTFDGFVPQDARADSDVRADSDARADSGAVAESSSVPKTPVGVIEAEGDRSDSSTDAPDDARGEGDPHTPHDSGGPDLPDGAQEIGVGNGVTEAGRDAAAPDALAEVPPADTSRFLVNKYSGKCVDVEGSPGIANLTPVRLAECEYNISDTDQKWERTPDGFLRNTLSGRCLDVDGLPGTSHGAIIQIFDCEFSGFSWNNATTDQRWEFTEDGLIQNTLSANCIDVDGTPGTATGSTIHLWQCEFSGVSYNGLPSDQQWGTTEGRLVNNLSGKCIVADAPDGGARADRLRLAECQQGDAATAGAWQFTWAGLLKDTASDLCMALDSAPPGRDVPAVVLVNCAVADAADDSEIWEMTHEGFVRNRLSGKCLDIDGQSGRDGVIGLQLKECKYDATYTHQRWRFER